MSLVNQMLRDLEKRRQPTLAASAPLAVHSVAPAGGAGARWRLLLPLPLLFIAVFLAPQTEPWLKSAARLFASDRTPPAANPPLPETVAPQNPPQAPAAQAYAQAPTPIAPPIPPQQPETVIARSDTPPAAVKAQPPSPARAPALAAAASPTAPKPSPVTENRPSPAQQAATLIGQAKSADAHQGKLLLQQALQLDPGNLAARTLLLQTMLRLKVTDAELSAFADDCLAQFPDNLLFIKTRAHLYLQRQNVAEAVALLERVEWNEVDDPAYLALLAAAYQQLQQFSKAVDAYQRLLQIQPDKAENWLGLALGRDKLGQNQAAAFAYRQALEKNTLKAAVVDYISQRLGVLE